MNATRKAVAAGVAALALAGGLAACGGTGNSTGASAPAAADPNAPEVNPAGDIPDNQAFVAYTPPGADYSVKVPEGWARSESQGAVTFTDKLNAIRIETAAASAAPSVATVKSQDVPALSASVPGFALKDVTTVTRQAGPGVLVTYQATAAANSVTGKSGVDAVERYVFFHKGKDVILTLSGPKGADNVDPWRIVTDSLAWSA